MEDRLRAFISNLEKMAKMNRRSAERSPDTLIEQLSNNRAEVYEFIIEELKKEVLGEER